MAPRKHASTTKSTTKRDKLQLNKETLKDLTAKGGAQIKGGANVTGKFSCYRPYCA